MFKLKKTIKRYELRYVEKRLTLQGEWRPSIELTYKLIRMFDETYYDDYTFVDGKKIDLITGYNNASHLLEKMESITNTIVGESYIDIKDIAPCETRSDKTLDDFMVTQTGNVIRIHDFFREFYSAVQKLYVALQNTSNPDMKKLYVRRMKGLSVDLFAIMEALITAALLK